MKCAFFFFKQKTAYEMRISDWSSDVCSSDLGSAMFAVADVREDEVETELDDFVAKARERTAIGFDPRPQIETMMTRALGPETAENVLARIIPTQDACQIDLLDWLEPGDVASIIAKEHPQVAALLTANPDPDRKSAV